ncbi:MAG: sulfotransferase domain-containing protein [Spirulinaceae cyanobacterium]
MNLPNFLIIGAMKAGTTSLYNYLEQHPQIYMSSLKEPNFFSYKGNKQQPITTKEEYCSLFTQVRDEIAIGEASTTYLSSRQAPNKIYQMIPQVKLIAILRDPAERAYSQYLMHYRSKNLVLEEKEILNGFTQSIAEKRPGLVGGGRYYNCLKRYLNVFDPNQLKICFFEDLKTQPTSLLQELFAFLQVENDFIVTQSSKAYNSGGIPSNKGIYNYLEFSKQIFNNTIKPLIPKTLIDPIYQAYVNFRNANLVKAPPLPEVMRQQVIEVYRPDILALQELVRRDLAHWLK